MNRLSVLPLVLLAFSVSAETVPHEDTFESAPVLVANEGFESKPVELDAGPRPPVRVPRTEFDTAHRFNMDSGKKLTAAEFDAWLASMGARVVGAEAVAAVDLPNEGEVEGEPIAEAVPAAATETVPSAPQQVPATALPVKYQVVE